MAKLIYQPKGKAREYSPWACNLYNGCTNRCTYCYNRKGVACKLLGKDDVTLKSGLDNFTNVFLTFQKELCKYKEQIIADSKGLFFNFVSDPFLEETWKSNYHCANYAMGEGVPCVFLSKKVPSQMFVKLFEYYKDIVKVGFTLTGHDELEPGADTNGERIDAIRKLTGLGITTWASIEPVIDIKSSSQMIASAYQAGCRDFKIGLLSGKKEYTPEEVKGFKMYIHDIFGGTCSIQWKDSVIDYITNE